MLLTTPQPIPPLLCTRTQCASASAQWASTNHYHQARTGSLLHARHLHTSNDPSNSNQTKLQKYSTGIIRACCEMSEYAIFYYFSLCKIQGVKKMASKMMIQGEFYTEHSPFTIMQRNINHAMIQLTVNFLLWYNLFHSILFKQKSMIVRRQVRNLYLLEDTKQHGIHINTSMTKVRTYAFTSLQLYSFSDWPFI